MFLSRGSVSALGTRRASFFDHSPPVPVFAPPTPHQTICPQDGRGDVATSDLVPFYWEHPRRQDVAIPPTCALQGRFAVQHGLLGGLPEVRINLGF